MQKLEQADTAIEGGDAARARRMLDAFRHEVRAQAGKKIGRSDADDLIAAADAVKRAIGC